MEAYNYENTDLPMMTATEGGPGCAARGCWHARLHGRCRTTRGGASAQAGSPTRRCPAYGRPPSAPHRAPAGEAVYRLVVDPEAPQRVLMVPPDALPFQWKRICRWAGARGLLRAVARWACCRGKAVGLKGSPLVGACSAAWLQAHGGAHGDVAGARLDAERGVSGAAQRADQLMHRALHRNNCFASDAMPVA